MNMSMVSLIRSLPCTSKGDGQDSKHCQALQRYRANPSSRHLPRWLLLWSSSGRLTVTARKGAESTGMTGMSWCSSGAVSGLILGASTGSHLSTDWTSLCITTSWVHIAIRNTHLVHVHEPSLCMKMHCCKIKLPMVRWERLGPHSLAMEKQLVACELSRTSAYQPGS